MTCKNIQMTYSDTPESDLPSEVRSHLEACAGCRTYFQQCSDLRSLLAFKRYEQPAPEVAGRIQYKVRARIEAVESIQPEPAAGGWRLGLRYATLVALAAVVFTNLYIVLQSPPKDAAVAEWQAVPAKEMAAVPAPFVLHSNDPTRLFFDDALAFGFAPDATHTNLLPVWQPPRSGGGNFEFIDYRP